MSDISGSWEEHSVDEEELGNTDDSIDSEDRSDGGGSSSEDEEGVDEAGGVLDEEVRGAKPYRFEPLAADDRERANPDAGGRLNNTEWCSCGHCVVQPMAVNCICCKEVQKTRAQMAALNINVEDENQSLAVHDWFEAVCLHPAVLQTAYLQYR